MSEHPFAGETVTLLIDGEEEEYQLEDGISQSEGEAFINSMLGVDAAEPLSEINHPEFEFVDCGVEEYPQPTGFRTICRIDDCTETEVFDKLEEAASSEWSEVELPRGILTDSTEFTPAFCPCHSMSE